MTIQPEKSEFREILKNPKTALSCNPVIPSSDQSTQNTLRFKMRGHMTPQHQPTQFWKKSQKLLSSSTITSNRLEIIIIQFSAISASIW